MYGGCVYGWCVWLVCVVYVLCVCFVSALDYLLALYIFTCPCMFPSCLLSISLDSDSTNPPHTHTRSHTHTPHTLHPTNITPQTPHNTHRHSVMCTPSQQNHDPCNPLMWTPCNQPQYPSTLPSPTHLDHRPPHPPPTPGAPPPHHVQLGE